MTSHANSAATTYEDARHELSHRLAQVIREGQVGMQVRFVQEGDSHLVWVYTRKEHEWKKRDDCALSANVAEPLYDLLEGLFAQKYADAWTVHRTEHSDRIDFELKFSRESIEPHIKGDLESYLNGCLAHDHHDSGADSRRRIRFRNT